MIKVIITDDHLLVIDGILAMLSDQPDIQAIGHAENGKALLDMLTTQQPDVILMDINMPGFNGIETTRQVKATYPNIQVLILTMHNDKESIANVLEAGAAGYILKNTGKKEMISAIKKVAAGGRYFSEAVTNMVMDSLTQPTLPETAEPTVFLTPREKDILTLIAKELTATQIAEQLFITVNTVETHRKNLRQKLKVRSTGGLIKWAISNGLG